MHKGTSKGGQGAALGAHKARFDDAERPTGAGRDAEADRIGAAVEVEVKLRCQCMRGVGRHSGMRLAPFVCCALGAGRRRGLGLEIGSPCDEACVH